MKRKGFTLIELLAVIVILAVISLIVTPMIMNVIEDTKLKAAEQSVNGYLDAIEKQVITSELTKENQISEGVYTVPMKKVEVKGSKPTSGWVVIQNGEVVNYSMVMNDYVVTKGSETVKNNKIVLLPFQKAHTTDTYKGIIYLDPTDLTKVCSTENSTSATEIKIGCMKWYVFDDKGDNYTMILDHNTTSKVPWNSSGSNSEMKEVAVALENDTQNWNNSLKARLITAEEIAKIIGFTNFNTSTASSWVYLDSNSKNQVSQSQGSSRFAWLFDYTDGCINFGCNIADSNTYGYWTSTSVYNSNQKAYRINGDGTFDGNSSFVTKTQNGIRPVITIPKSIISK